MAPWAHGYRIGSYFAFLLVPRERERERQSPTSIIELKKILNYTKTEFSEHIDERQRRILCSHLLYFVFRNASEIKTPLLSRKTNKYLIVQLERSVKITTDVAQIPKHKHSECEYFSAERSERNNTTRYLIFGASRSFFASRDLFNQSCCSPRTQGALHPIEWRACLQ